jgi:hypothetical protein
MFKKLIFVAVLVVLVATAYASAATLGVYGGSVQAGVDSSLYCDSAVNVTGWGVETDTSLVSYVKIGDIDAACVGNKMHVRVFDGADVALGPQVTKTLTAAGTETFTFAAPIPVASIETLRVWIDGPSP